MAAWYARKEKPRQGKAIADMTEEARAEWLKLARHLDMIEGEGEDAQATDRARRIYRDYWRNRKIACDDRRPLRRAQQAERRSPA